MNVIWLELSGLSFLELEKLSYLKFIYNPASANIDQSALNLVTIYMTNRSQTSLIMGIIGPELFALELEKNAKFDFVYTLASTNINQSAPNLVKVYVTIRSQISYYLDLIRNWTVICPWIRKTAIINFVYYLTSANIDESAPNLAKIGMTNRSGMSSITWTWTTGVICSWIRKIDEFDLVYTVASTNINQSASNFVKIYMTIRSCGSVIMGGIWLKQHELFTLQFLLLYLTWFVL